MQPPSKPGGVLGRTLTRGRTAPKPFLLSTTAAAVLLAAALVACGEGAGAGERTRLADLERRIAARPSPAELFPLDLPAREPTAEERIAFYVRLLEGGDRVELTWAQEQLGLAGEAAIPALARALDRSLGKNPAFAENVLSVLAERVPAGGRLALLSRAARSRKGRVRLMAARALAGTGSPAAAAPLLDLAGDGLYVVAAAAVEGLDRLGAEEGARGLRGRFPDRLQAGVRTVALRVAGRLLPEKEAVPFLLSVLASGETDEVIAAAGALLRRGDRSGLDPLWELTRDGLGGQPRYAALEVLAKAEDPRPLPELAGAATGGSKHDRIASVGLLGFYRSPRARKLLRVLTGDSDRDVRREAWNSLLASGDPAARPGVLRLLRSSRPADRLLAGQILGSLRDPATVPDLVRACDMEEERSVRMVLTTALALLEVPEGAAAIARSLLAETEADPSTAVLARTAKASLNRFERLPGEAVALLVEAARSRLRSVRFHAAIPLGRGGEGEEAAAALLSLLADESADLRRLAAHAWLSFRDATLEPLRAAHARETVPELAKALARVARQLAHRWPR